MWICLWNMRRKSGVGLAAFGSQGIDDISGNVLGDLCASVLGNTGDCLARHAGKTIRAVVEDVAVVGTHPDELDRGVLLDAFVEFAQRLRDISSAACSGELFGACLDVGDGWLRVSVNPDPMR